MPAGGSNIKSDMLREVITVLMNRGHVRGARAINVKIVAGIV